MSSRPLLLLEAALIRSEAHGHLRRARLGSASVRLRWPFGTRERLVSRIDEV